MLLGFIDFLIWSFFIFFFIVILDRWNLDSWGIFLSVRLLGIGWVVIGGGSRLFSFLLIVVKYEFKEVVLFLFCSVSELLFCFIGLIVFWFFGLVVLLIRF